MTAITKQQKAETAKIFEQALIKRMDQLQTLKISKEHFQQMLLNALVRNPQLASCSQVSLYDAVFRCVEWGMAPDGKHGAIVPMRKQGKMSAEFWPMIDGILIKVRQAIPNIAIHSDVAFNGDEWDDIRGTNPSLFHKPNPDVDRSEQNMLAVYAVAHMPGNPVPEYEVMYANEAMVFKKNNKGPWTTWPIQMYRARVLKRLLSRLPINLSLMNQLNQSEEEVLEIDEDTVVDAEPIDVTPIEAPPPAPAKKAPAKKAPAKKAAPAPQPAPEPEPEPEPEPAPEPEMMDDEEDDDDIF